MKNFSVWGLTSYEMVCNLWATDLARAENSRPVFRHSVQNVLETCTVFEIIHICECSSDTKNFSVWGLTSCGKVYTICRPRTWRVQNSVWLRPILPVILFPSPQQNLQMLAKCNQMEIYTVVFFFK